MSAVQIVVLGKSLGGAVALHLASSNPSSFKAIVVENTFLSIEDVAPKASLCNQQKSQHAVAGQCLHLSVAGHCSVCGPLIWPCFPYSAGFPNSTAEGASGLQMLPFLGPVLGRGKMGNFLIRNKWRSYDAIRKLRHIPMLMLSAGQVRTPQACRARSHAALVSCADLGTHPLICRCGQLCMIAQVGVLRYTRVIPLRLAQLPGAELWPRMSVAQPKRCTCAG